jgi:type IV pilus assembly protein PilB
MGVEPFLVTASTNLLIAQRLIRVICPKCREPIQLSEEILNELQLDPSATNGLTFFKARGCYDCNETGYRGRHGVYEVMPVTSAIRELILNRAPARELKQQAVKEGMLTLRMDALEKLKRGVTSAEEVLKETAPDE